MNAIILAAGMGTRFKEITKKTHKALLPIGGVPNIERTILALRETGVEEVVIVTGHLHEQFDYLEEKFGCRLIYNSHYSDYNNIYSFYLAKEYLGDSYLIDGDVVLLKNIFQQLEESHYYTLVREPSEDKEWIPCLDEAGYVQSMRISNEEKPSLLGISYWNRADAERLKKESEAYLREEVLTDPSRYWDQIPLDLLPTMHVRTVQVDRTEAGEMDHADNYSVLCKLV